MNEQELIAAESKLVELWNDGQICHLSHFCGGNEEILCDLFEAIKPTDWVFASHRCHFHFLLHHKDEEFLYENSVAHDVVDELISQVLQGRSMFLYGKRFLCSAIVAGTASIAAGMALSIQRRGGPERVYCFLGDGAEDEGNFYEAVRLVTARNLPCNFIIEDNGTSCGVTHAQRGSPEEWEWPDCVLRYHYKPTFPHAGTNVRPKLKWKP